MAFERANPIEAKIIGTENFDSPSCVPYRLYDHDDFPYGSFFYYKTNSFITHYFRNYDDLAFPVKDLFSFITKHEMKEIFSREWVSSTGHFSRKVFLKEIDNKLFTISFTTRIENYGKKSHKENDSNIDMYSNIDVNDFNTLLGEIKKISKKRKYESNNISLVIQTRSGYDTQRFELPKQKINLEYNYGKDFLPIHQKIISRLNQPKGKGLVLLHGIPGSGKTHYLKYLANQIKDKNVMFIPPYLVDFITSPEMTPFLIQNSNSVLFIEDAERVITDRNVNGSPGVSNILNITDGILSDVLNIQIVATFNMDKKKIDEALLRKGRLIAEHKFDKLSQNDANRLIKHLDIKDYVATSPMSLTEIYNIGEEEFKSEERPKIGFKH